MKYLKEAACVARFSHPQGLAIDATAGHLLLADTGNNTICRITPAE